MKAKNVTYASELLTKSTDEGLEAVIRSVLTYNTTPLYRCFVCLHKNKLNKLFQTLRTSCVICNIIENARTKTESKISVYNACLLYFLKHFLLFCKGEK